MCTHAHALASFSPDLRASDSMYCKRYRAHSWWETTAACSTITFSKGACISLCRHTHTCDRGRRGERGSSPVLHQCSALERQPTLTLVLHSSHLALTSFITLERPCTTRKEGVLHHPHHTPTAESHHTHITQTTHPTHSASPPCS